MNALKKFLSNKIRSHYIKRKSENDGRLSSIEDSEEDSEGEEEDGEEDKFDEDFLPFTNQEEHFTADDTTEAGDSDTIGAMITIEDAHKMLTQSKRSSTLMWKQKFEKEKKFHKKYFNILQLIEVREMEQIIIECREESGLPKLRIYSKFNISTSIE